MSASFAIAAREFVERRAVIWAALAAAVLPFMSPLLPGVATAQGNEARELMCMILASALGVGSALLVGSGIIARDLSEGRMGFDFARPVGAMSIWAGRFLGAFAVVVAAVTVVALPTYLADQLNPGPAGRAALSPVAAAAAALLGAVLCLLPLAHAASISLRSKSLWLAVDLIALVLTALTIGLLARALINAWALQLAVGLGVVFAIVAVAALWLASILQVTVGRTDLRRSHRAQSLALWGTLLCALLVSAGYVKWVLSAGPRDLVEIEVTPAPSGDWVGVSGSSSGRFDYRPALLVNARDGRTVRLGGAQPWTSGIEFSADGRRAVWVHCTLRGDKPCDVMIVDLGAGDPIPRLSTVAVPGPFAVWPVLSTDGTRLALWDDSILSVHDLDTGRVVASARVDRDAERASSPQAYFTRDGTVRLHFIQPRLEVYEFDPATRALMKTGDGPEVEAYALRVLSPDGERLVARRAETRETLVLDARSGAVLATYPRTFTGGSVLAFLDDGRIAVGERDANGSRLHILSRDGLEERVIELKRSDLSSVGAGPDAGSLVLTFGEPPLIRTQVSVDAWIFDLATGTSREIAKRRVPIGSWGYVRSPRQPGGAVAELFHTGKALVRIDPRSGEESLIAGQVESR